MIYVPKDQLNQVDYLLEQSMQGNHILFDSDLLRETLCTPSAPISDEQAYSVEPHLERIITEPTIEQKRAYLDALDEETRRLVIRTYFNIVENNIFESLEVKH